MLGHFNKVFSFKHFLKCGQTPLVLSARGVIRFNALNKRAKKNADQRKLPIYRFGEYDRLREENPQEFESLKFQDFVAAPSNESASRFDDPFLTRVVNHIMRKGQKAEAEDMVREVMYLIKKDQISKWRSAADQDEKSTYQLDPLVLMKTAVKNVRPVVYCRPIRKGGVVYQVPVPMTDFMSEYFALRWIRQAAFDHPNPWREIFVPAFTREFLRAFKMEGKAIKSKYDLHKLAESNKAYAHYRWG